LEDVDRILEAWKKVVDVQMHFNDIELRIRNLAVTISGAILGAAGLAVEKGITPLNVFSLKISIYFVLFTAGAIVLVLFHFMDRFWYHRLLKGSVISGSTLKNTLQQRGISIDLGQRISELSPFTLFCRVFHSTTKIDIFYYVPINMFLILAFVSLCPLSIAASIPVSAIVWLIVIRRLDELPPSPKR
jgi:hypothetical protein